MNIVEKTFELECRNPRNDNELLFYVSEELFWEDCYIIGEPIIACNVAFYHIYDLSKNSLYLIGHDDLFKLGQGVRIKLYGRKPDEEDKEMLAAEGF